MRKCYFLLFMRHCVIARRRRRTTTTAAHACPPPAMDLCTVSVVCPCKLPPKIIRLTTKTFADIIKEVKQCRCRVAIRPVLSRTVRFLTLLSSAQPGRTPNCPALRVIRLQCMCYCLNLHISANLPFHWYRKIADIQAHSHSATPHRSLSRASVRISFSARPNC